MLYQLSYIGITCREDLNPFSTRPANNSRGSLVYQALKNHTHKQLWAITLQKPNLSSFYVCFRLLSAFNSDYEKRTVAKGAFYQ
ncbi:hypothetical protein HRM2_36440 [Desulforapulum autotrophicum HRM2]|uniref:Uncharacterized protein n=1 Tax=Desulforapulum autotrophicum (strain ATCC 43914 / DSM 3382 / VKM B-1955 / HRM2) TaxID=177437 RepID=C0Q9Y8_DESAH|nr:hypothetical protein HRM2_36440 [Desulforapulum autotrophicum HRM2]